MMRNPAKAYLVDGFPRAVDQALLFEQTLLECQTILHFEVTKETMFARCMIRAETSGRADDNEETINKRVETYFQSSEPVITHYKHFGKVRIIDANSTDISGIYQ